MSAKHRLIIGSLIATVVVMGTAWIEPVMIATKSPALQAQVARAQDRAEAPKQTLQQPTDVRTPTVAGSTVSTEEKVREYFKDVPVLVSIAQCESNFRHHDTSGGVLRGRVNAADVGVMQVNERYHAATATKLGINLHELEGNMAYARYLYRQQGTQPWSASSHCWR